jgi:thiamine biosynthesis lipoprotein
MFHQTCIMGMPCRINIVHPCCNLADVETILSYLRGMDDIFSPYKESSEVSRINRGELAPEEYSTDMRRILRLGEQTARATGGYFDIRYQGHLDPSGLVKGFAIHHASQLLQQRGFENFYIDLGGDVQVHGRNDRGAPWSAGIQNPFNLDEIVKVVHVTDCGVATSGNYLRGNHIYNPVQCKWATDIASLTVIGPNVYEADRFATAAFAMGQAGLQFIQSLDGFEGYMITLDRKAYLTSGFSRFAGE